jgi:hypothetical protein
MARAESRLERALSELRQTAPREFTRKRNSLVAELGREGLRKEAAAIKRARKPSASVWAIAALARDAPDVLAQVLDAGAAVRREQRRAVSGAGAGSLREATRGFHEAISATVRAAEEQLRNAGERPSAAVIDRIRQTLLASAEAPDEVREAIREGTLEEDLSPAGFGDVGALRILSPPREHPAPEGRRAPAPEERRQRDQEERRRAQAERARIQEERRSREERARRQRLLRGELERLERALRAAEDEERRIEQIAQAMEQRAHAARVRATNAHSATEAARQARDAARRKLAAADREPRD